MSVKTKGHKVETEWAVPSWTPAFAPPRSIDSTGVVDLQNMVRVQRVHVGANHIRRFCSKIQEQRIPKIENSQLWGSIVS